MQPDPKSNPEVQELQTETQALVDLAGSYSVTNAEEYAASANDLKRVKGALDRLEKIRKSMTQPLDAAKRAIMDFFRDPEAKLQRAEASIKRVLIAYNKEQRRIQQEAQARAEAAARKEREKLEQRAASAAAAGKDSKADELLHRASSVVAPVISREVPKVAGLANRKVWKYRIKDASLLPREFTKPDDQKIAGVVRAMKADTKIPGIEVYSEDSLASSAA
jgi:hypothetical protein